MTKGKVTASLQQLFIAFLVLMLALIAGAFVLKSALSAQISKLDSQLNIVSAPAELDSVILLLNSAENDFQQACLHNDETALSAYKATIANTLNQVAKIIGDPAKAQKDVTGLGRSFQEKTALSQQLFHLHQDFDSLMKKTTALSLGMTGADHAQINNIFRDLKADTVIATKKESSKAGLFRRLKDAIRNKAEVKVVTIRERTNAKVGKLTHVQQVALQHSVLDLNRQYNTMGIAAKQLVAANLKMLFSLRSLIERVRKIEVAARQKSKNEILKQYRETSDTMDHFTTAGLLMLLLFTLLLIFYVKRTVNVEKEYLQENARAVTLAGQKSEILAVMSHEVRNKLTAINGAVFILKRSELSSKQLQKLDAVSYASDMLLDTVNNILDVSKIEYGSTELLRLQPFQPLIALKEAVEAMRFSAERNELNLVLLISGNTEQLVSGDALRLKQVVINLVGNAIKFTKTGEITISGELCRIGLSVTVKDTGIGIDPVEQSKLFDRYYQAGKDGVKPGTGLGLYLCRQLVELQGGQISLESNPGEGTTIKFNIPYDAATGKLI